MTVVVFKRIMMFAVIVIPATSGAADDRFGPAVESARIDVGNLSVHFRDNSESPGVLSGVQSLFNVKEAPGFDAYDPEGRGSSAGLNFEHIISGHQSEHNKFTPRQGTYTLQQLPDGQSVRLVRKAEDSPWRIASTLTYTVVEPHFIDFDFRCTPEDASLFGDRGWALMFFANYMHEVVDTALHFRGVAEEGGEETWIRADAPPGHADWNTGGNYRHLEAAPLGYDDEVTFRLNTWSYDWPRFTEPCYYGLSEHDMTFILMFDRTHSVEDEMRLSLFKFKVNEQQQRPAWDFQYVIHKVEADREYGFRGRLVWKKFVSPDDCRREYMTWARETP